MPKSTPLGGALNLQASSNLGKSKLSAPLSELQKLEIVEQIADVPRASVHLLLVEYQACSSNPSSCLLLSFPIVRKFQESPDASSCQSTTKELMKGKASNGKNPSCVKGVLLCMC